MRRFGWLLVLVPLLLASPLQAKPEAGEYSKEQYTVKAARGQKVPMRDGVRLSADIYRPDADGKFPAIVLQTPYSNNAAGLVVRARWFARRGYAVVLSDCRGRFDSEGDWDPFNAKHKTDGYDLIEWVAKQPWCDGKVGTMGASYSGWTQWWTATQTPPALRAMVPEVSPPDAFYNAPYQQGVLVGWALDWAAMMSGRTMQSAGEGPYGGFAPTRADDMKRLPYVGLNERRGALDSPWFETWFRQNLSTGDYWRSISYQGEANYARVKVPTLAITGWFDANFPGSPMNYAGMKAHGATAEGRRPRLVIGPWTHGYNAGRKLVGIDYGPDAVIDWNGYVCRWFDHFLKGVENGVEKDEPVHVFVMGENRWRAEKDWPLPDTRWTKFYLHGKGKANSRKGDGTLDRNAPADEPADEYAYEPQKPTMAPPSANGHLDGPIDPDKPAEGQEVLVYSTGPLAEDIEVTGPVTAKLRRATPTGWCGWWMFIRTAGPRCCAMGSSALVAATRKRRVLSLPTGSARLSPRRCTNTRSISGGPRPTASAKATAFAWRCRAATSRTTCATPTPARTTSAWKPKPWWPGRRCSTTRSTLRTWCCR
jgi:putative CocE/NonD family hydrolase